jgi:hypothetical protein
VPVEALVAAADYVDMVITTGGQRDFRSWVSIKTTIAQSTSKQPHLVRLVEYNLDLLTKLSYFSSAWLLNGSSAQLRYQQCHYPV